MMGRMITTVTTHNQCPVGRLASDRVPSPSLPRYGGRNAAITWLIMLLAVLQCHAATIVPPAGLLGEPADSSSTHMSVMTFSDLMSVPEFLSHTKPSRPVGGPILRAGYEATMRSTTVTGRWTLGIGTTRRTVYHANHDAGQLWTDLSTHVQTAQSYRPWVTGTRFLGSWIGAATHVQLQIGDRAVRCEAAVRAFDADDLLIRTATGTMQGDDFTGMVKTINGGHGEGWAVDARTVIPITRGAKCTIAADGILGSVTWQNVSIEDDYIVSPRTFEDPDGFLRDFAAISGAGWRENVRLKFAPTWHVDIATGDKTLQHIGATYDADRKWVPYLTATRPLSRDTRIETSYMPSERQLGVAVVGRRGHCQVAVGGNGGHVLQNTAINIGFGSLAF
jgi:hypothetical protein